MKKLPLLFLAMAALAFVLGLLHLFQIRFDAGDSYPPYSSFRTDPLGAKALYESLDALRPARRHLQSLARLGEGRDRTLLWLGGSPEDLKFSTNDFRALDTFVRSGGRLVIAPQPAFVRPRTNLFMMRAAARRGATGPGGAPTNAPPSTPTPWDDPRGERLQERWGFSTDQRDLARDAEGNYQPDTAELRDAPASPVLPPTLKVWTALGFRPSNSAWRTLYTRGSGTSALGIILERDLGRGSIVLAADAYRFSNEALRDDRQPGLLAWFAGAGREVVFEETHLGVREHPGIATLARKYGLQTFLGALLLLAALFLWRNTTHFMPPFEQQQAADTGDIVEGRDAGAGFVNLLRRHIPPAQLLRVCLEQWNAHVARTRPPGRDRLEAMQQRIDAENAVEPGRRDPVGAYREFCRILGKRKRIS